MDAPMQVLSRSLLLSCRRYCQTRAQGHQWRKLVYRYCLKSEKERCVCQSQIGSIRRNSTISSLQEDIDERLGSITESRNITLEERQQARPLFRTRESDPLNHSLDHEGLFYTVPQEDIEKTSFVDKVLPFFFRRQGKVFNEFCLMVRRPAVEIFEYIKSSNLKLPINKIVLYGENGHGKTMTLAHTFHYFQRDGWVIMHVPWLTLWSRQYKELSVSQSEPEKFDIPMEAAEWLKHFRKQNPSLLQGFKTTETYVWSKRESTEEGTELTDLIDFGITRVKYSCEVTNVLMKELKKCASDNRIKIAVLLDGVNGLWHPGKLWNQHTKFTPLDPSRITLMCHFRDMLKADWNGGIAVCIAEEGASAKDIRESNTPKYLLTKEGFEWLDPFIPVHVPEYSDKEAYSCMEYYIDRQWIQSEAGRSEDGKKQILFLSQKNPFCMMRTVDPW